MLTTWSGCVSRDGPGRNEFSQIPQRQLSLVGPFAVEHRTASKTVPGPASLYVVIVTIKVVIGWH